MKTYKSKPDAVIDLLSIINNAANNFFGVIEHLNFSDTLDDVNERYGADSIDSIELIMILEEELEIEIDDDTLEALKVQTIGQLIDYLVTHVKIEEPKLASNFGIKITPTGPVTIAASTLASDTKDSKLTSAPTANDAVGILWLPSLEWHGRIYKVEGVTMAEAIEQMNEYAVKASKKRKTKEFKSVDSDFQHSEFFVNVIDTDSFPPEVLDDPRYFNKDIMSMMESKVPQTRGLRPLYLAHNVIGIGTTVIYNKNWATVHFEDQTALNRLLQIQARYEEVEEEEEEFDDSYEESDSDDEY